MDLAMKQIRAGKPVIGAQISTGYESSSGFRDASAPTYIVRPLWRFHTLADLSCTHIAHGLCQAKPSLG